MGLTLNGRDDYRLSHQNGIPEHGPPQVIAVLLQTHKARIIAPRDQSYMGLALNERDSIV
jgi:hypothetical protein